MGLIGNDVAPLYQIFDNYDLYNSRSDFTFVRLMNGTWIEPTFSSLWNNIHTRKAPYLNLKPYYSISEQVNTFYDKVMELASDFSLPPVFDTENLLLTQSMISTAWSLGYQKFGNYPMPYSSKYYWPKAYPEYPSVPNWVASYPNSLIGVRYDSVLESKIQLAMLYGFPTMPDDWGEFMSEEDFWQCSKSGYGPDWGLKWPDSKAIDVDYFDGTEEDLDAVMDKWSGIAPPPPIPPAGEIVPLRLATVTVNANIRSLPDVGGEDIGTLVAGSVIPVIEEVEKGEWLHIEGYVYKKLTK